MGKKRRDAEPFFEHDARAVTELEEWRKHVKPRIHKKRVE